MRHAKQVVIENCDEQVKSEDIEMEHDYAFKTADSSNNSIVDESIASPASIQDDIDGVEEHVVTDEITYYTTADAQNPEEEEDGTEEDEQVMVIEDCDNELAVEEEQTAAIAPSYPDYTETQLDNILIDRTDAVNHIPTYITEPMNSLLDHKCYTVRVVDNKETHQCVYACDICGKRFRNKRCAKLCKNAIKDPYNKYYLCEICGKVFTYISSFIAHHNYKHSEQKLFLKQQRLMECSVCLKKFSTKWNLKTHMQSHMNVFPYLCEFCGKKFKKSDIFKIHLRIHTGIKPYGCPQCEKRFATKGMMTTHLRSHTGEKPYSCEFCDKTYAGMTALRMHRRKHTGERPYKCHLCPTERTFVTKKALRLHLKQPLHN